MGGHAPPSGPHPHQGAPRDSTAHDVLLKGLVFMEDLALYLGSTTAVFCQGKINLAQGNLAKREKDKLQAVSLTGQFFRCRECALLSVTVWRSS